MATIMVMDVAFAHAGVVILDYTSGKGWTVVTAETVSTKKSDAKKGVRVADDDVRRTQGMFNRLIALAHEHSVVGLIAEIPTGGSRNQRASRAMGMATALAACVASALDLVCEWTTPKDGKKALCGIENASKQQMKKEAATRWPDTTKKFHLKRKTAKTKNKEAEWDDDYEHVADAMGAFCAARNGVVEKMVVQYSKLENKNGTRKA